MHRPALALLLLGLIVPGCFWLETVTHNDYSPPPDEADAVLADDLLDDKPAPHFDPKRIDPRPIDGWRLNASAAVMRLDVPPIKPDTESALLLLYPSYAAALSAQHGDAERTVLPSINLLDNKAKQFDDGLYAALDHAYYRGLQERLRSHVQLIRRLYERVGQDSPAAPFLAAGLELAGVRVAVANEEAKAFYLAEFRDNEIASKPIGFYTWNRELVDCFRFLRFFQKEFDAWDCGVPRALAAALASDEALRSDYRKLIDFYARLTNPYIARSLLDMDTDPSLLPAVTRNTYALLPPSTSRETVLFKKLFPDGLPTDAHLMRTLIRTIRSGEIDLRPKPESGWYDYQVYALETLLLPEKGEESRKLLLKKRYKQRTLAAFEAILTKRRETHVRQLPIPDLAISPPPMRMSPAAIKVQPRLRIEPCPSYYLRTARAYRFLARFLEERIGAPALRSLHGLRQGGAREMNLHSELYFIRDLFYGLYLLSAEDIGMKPDLAKDEVEDGERCYRIAADWLPKAFADSDYRVDSRVIVPIAVDRGRGVTRSWATLGVRLAKLDAEYARPPHIKPEGGGWQVAESAQLQASHYLIAIDEFAEVEWPGLRVLTREEFRALCDRGWTRQRIVQLLRGRK